MTAPRPILCAGSALWDIIARTPQPMRRGADLPGRIAQQLGGVALNVALALARRGRRVELLSAVGRDPAGRALIAQAESLGVGCAHLTHLDGATDSYLAIEDAGGDVFGAVADCAGLERAGRTVLAPLSDGRLATPGAPWDGALVVDGNFDEVLLNDLAQNPCFTAARLALVPASPGKAARLAGAMRHPRAVLYVNRIEAGILAGTDFPDAETAACALHRAGAHWAVVTDGPNPAASVAANHRLTAHPPAVPLRSATGAGDAFLAAHLDATTQGAAPAEALDRALAAAAAHISQEPAA